MEQVVHMTVGALQDFIFGYALSYWEYTLLLEQISIIHLQQLLLWLLASFLSFFSLTNQLLQLEVCSSFFLIACYSSIMAIVISSSQTVAQSFEDASKVMLVISYVVPLFYIVVVVYRVAVRENCHKSVIAE